MCSLGGIDDVAQLRWAACLLLRVADSWPQEDIPKDLAFFQGSNLLIDAQNLLANARSHNFQLEAK